MGLFFSLKPRNRFSLIKAFNWYTANLQILLICKLKLSLSSIWISCNSTVDTTFMFWLSTVISWLVWLRFLFSNRMAWNLSGLTINLLFLNQSITIPDSDSKLSINSQILSGIPTAKYQSTLNLFQQEQIMCCHQQNFEARHWIQKIINHLLIS